MLNPKPILEERPKRSFEISESVYYGAVIIVSIGVIFGLIFDSMAGRVFSIVNNSITLSIIIISQFIYLKKAIGKKLYSGDGSIQLNGQLFDRGPPGSQ
jgi:predicted Co/Zn/Cd cation transporter (cation efflux family)